MLSNAIPSSRLLDLEQGHSGSLQTYLWAVISRKTLLPSPREDERHEPQDQRCQQHAEHDLEDETALARGSRLGLSLLRLSGASNFPLLPLSSFAASPQLCAVSLGGCPRLGAQLASPKRNIVVSVSVHRAGAGSLALIRRLALARHARQQSEP